MTQNIETLVSEIESINTQIFELQKPINDQVFALNQKKQEAQDKLNKEVFLATAPQLQENDYHCGTANLETANFKFKTVVSKKVSWDEDVLRGVANTIRAAGRDPEEFIKYKLSVSETDFKKFPEEIQNAFLPARTVEPSKPVITYVRK